MPNDFSDNEFETCFDCQNYTEVVECGDRKYRCKDCWEKYADGQDYLLQLKAARELIADIHRSCSGICCSADYDLMGYITSFENKCKAFLEKYKDEPYTTD